MASSLISKGFISVIYKHLTYAQLQKQFNGFGSAGNTPDDRIYLLEFWNFKSLSY